MKKFIILFLALGFIALSSFTPKRIDKFEKFKMTRDQINALQSHNPKINLRLVEGRTYLFTNVKESGFELATLSDFKEFENPKSTFFQRPDPPCANGEAFYFTVTTFPNGTQMASCYVWGCWNGACYGQAYAHYSASCASCSWQPI